MSNQLVFFDSNIWLYQFILDPSQNTPENARKRKRSIILTDTKNTVVSTQVISEVCANLRRKAAFSESQLRQVIQGFYDRCMVIEINYEILINASDLRSQYNFSFWDGLVDLGTRDSLREHLREPLLKDAIPAL